MHRRTQLILVLALVPLVQFCMCSTFGRYLKNSHHRIEDGIDTGKLVRVKLSKSSDELDSFEALSRSRSITGRNEDNNPDHIDQPFSLNSQLVGEIGIGSPSQKFKVLFHTLYSNMWISSLNCTNCGNKKQYNCSASTTYIPDGALISPGWDMGFRSIDQVSLDNVSITNQTFVEMIYIDRSFYQVSYDGVFSLGIRDVWQEVSSPIQRMLEQGLIAKKVFSIYQNSSGGEVILGGSDPNQYEGEINWLPNDDTDGWTFKIDSLSLKQREDLGTSEVKVCSDSCDFTINTQYPYILGPPEPVRMINEAMGAHVDEVDDTMFILPDCDLAPLSNLTLTINSHRYELAPEVYIQKVKRGDKIVCLSRFHVYIYPFPDQWVVGTSVVGHIYTIFDIENRALGFARSK